MNTEQQIKNLPGEYWADVLGYEGFYKISNKGRVKSLYRLVESPIRGMVPRYSNVLKQHINPYGYLCTQLHKNGKHQNFRIHRLIALAFIPNPENKETINHKDGNKLNNEISNLEWATRAENTRHAWKNGLTKAVLGEKNGACKFSDATIKKIREYVSRTNKTYKECGMMFGVSESYVGAIITGKNRVQ